MQQYDITYTAGGADIIRVEDSQDNVAPAVRNFFKGYVTATALRVGALDGSKGGSATICRSSHNTNHHGYWR